MLKTIHLHGVLAEKFGKTFKLDVRSAREATHAIAMQIPAFKKFMLTAEQAGLKFAVFLGDRNIGEDRLDDITEDDHVHIVPKVVGAGGVLEFIGGAVLVGVGIFTANPALIGAGVGLMVGGVAQMLMPTPPVEGQDPDGNRANYGFGGAVTTIAQGNPVPILYGERDVGGFICSAGIYAEDTSAKTAN